MYWADRVAKEIIDSNKFKPYWVDDMKTPSGFPHVGSLRGPLIHDLIYKALRHTGQDVKFTYIFNDFDVIDGLPSELEEKFEKYMGCPLKTVPSPESGYDSFADFYTQDFKRVLENLGVEAEYLYSWDLYHEGKFDEVIKEVLDGAEKIQDIYQKISGSKKREMGWLPLQVICESCGKLGTTRVYEWDGEVVSYKCEETLVKWAIGCGFDGKISPFGGNGKLPWKVDWPAHWKVLGVTIEGAGKDHSSAGGSRDIAAALCSDIFKFPEPYNVPYEFILIGGKKMSTSGGVGLKARDLAKLLPLEVGRFLFCRTDYKQQVNFDPIGTMATPDLYDEYDRYYLAYIESSDETLSRTFEMSQIGELPPKEKTFLPRFRDVVNYVQQPSIDLIKKFEEIKDSALNEDEKRILREREKYAKIWLERYAPEEFKLQITQSLPTAVSSLGKEQLDYLREVVSLVKKDLDADSLQEELYNLSKEKGIATKKAFAAIYLVFLGKEFGPKAGAFLTQYPKDVIINRLEEVLR